ncbi:MAG: methyltransferase [Bdellovibrionales bacterium]|nr:methyltransferase [Bdellovibrionales bacterium]
MKRIRLKAKHDRRFRTGHPWAYSNELQESPKNLSPGEMLELQDPAGKFLAWGYGNPASLITFRAVSRDESEKDSISAAGVARRLESAWKLRRTLGFEETSHRLCFGEADRLPGLIIDRYRLADKTSAFIVQAQTAGADQWTKDFAPVIEEWRQINADESLRSGVFVIKNDSSSRKWEGLQLEPARILSGSSNKDLSQASILVRSADLKTPAPLEFQVDLLGGQKTGFFLDQWANIQLVLQRIEQWPVVTRRKQIRVLDLCCYVGQWSAQVSRFFEQRGVRVEVTLVDSSRAALMSAEKNVRASGATHVKTIEADVLRGLADLPDRAFDLVISDPPALIKGRKDVPVGTHAYLQLHTQSARLVAEQGAWVACSCSGLLTEESFLETISKASRRQARRFSWIARGGQSPDHPILAEFPEGRYLKCWLGLAD